MARIKAEDAALAAFVGGSLLVGALGMAAGAKLREAENQQLTGEAAGVDERTAVRRMTHKIEKQETSGR